MKIISAADFREMNDEEQRNLIYQATEKGHTECLDKDCLFAMLIYQTDKLDEAYEAFCYEQACASGNFDEI